MSNLPDGWVEIPLGEALQIQKGNKPIGLGPKDANRFVPYINISAFETKQVEQYAPEQDVPRCQPSDTLLVWDGARAGLAGKGIGGYIGSTLARLTSDLADPSYLYYFVHSNYGYLNTNTKGVGIPHIDPIVLKEISFPLPPAAEQIRIVAKIEELISDLDAGVAELKAAQKKLAQYRQSLLKAAVEGSLTAEWRAQNTPRESGFQLLQRILAERRARWEAKQLAKFAEQGKAEPKNWRKKYPDPVPPDITDLAVLPEGWVWASVEQLGSVQLGRQRSPNKIGKANPTPYIRAANITEAGVDLSDVLEMEFSETEKETFTLKVGDVLLTEASGSPAHVGRPAIWTHTQGLYCFQNTVLRFSPEGISSAFAYYSFLAMQKLGVFSQLSGGVGINHLSAGKFSKLSVALPPLAEQAALIEIIKKSFSRCDDQITFNTHSLKQSIAQRQNILKEAFSGRLVPQDPSEEPASELLERIRAERAERAKQPPKKRQSKKQKEATTMVSKLIDVLAEAGDWLDAQEAFRRCGVADGASSDRVEGLYAELRRLDKEGRLKVETVRDAQGRKVSDKLKLLAI